MYQRYQERNTTLRVVVVGALTLGICAGAGVGVNNCEYSSGERVGVVNKLSRKGTVFKTYEGQMTLEGLASNGEGVGANVWNFSIDETHARGENVAGLTKQLTEAMKSGRKVEISYKQNLTAVPWRGDTDYFVQSVKMLEPSKDKKE